MTEIPGSADAAAAVLDEARSSRRAADAAEARQMPLAVGFAAMRSVDSLDEAAVHRRPGYGPARRPAGG